jgi:diguanylate cyclase (GGDEF)-like protein/PAS domain S-box-containing protein
LHKSIETYKIIAEYAADSIFVIDNQGRISYANPASEKLFGFSADELSGKNLHDTIHHHHADDIPFPAEECPLVHAYMAGETIQDYITTFIKKDGILVTISCTISPVTIADKRAGSVLLARDITERIEAQKALSKSEARFRLITDSMPQIVWSTTPDGTINFVNARFHQYTGIKDHIGTAYASALHPDDASKLEATRREAVRTGSAYRFEHRLRAKDGSYRWFLSHGIPLKDERGNVLGWYGSSTDIDDIRRSSDALRRSQETLRLATEATGLGLWDFYPKAGKLVWSEKNRQIFGLPANQQINYGTFLECIHPEDRARVDRATQAAMRGKNNGRMAVEFKIHRASDGAERWLTAYGQALTDRAGELTRFIGTSVDITERKFAEQRIREASQHDALTGLPNRALLFEYCSHLLAMAKRTISSGALLFIDLDRFKPINDNYGHDIGDQVLKQVAERLVACTRREDIVGRLGGDEFVVAMPHPDDAHGPATVAQHIIDRVSEPYYIDDLELHLSPSIGISLYPKHGEDLDTLIRCADTAMYAAKKSGRKAYKFYDQSLDNSHNDNLSIEARLRHALEHNELILHYQPVMDIESGKVIGVEALLRLPVPEGALLLPKQFFPVAEAAGLINRLGEWVANEACRQHMQWRKAGLPEMIMAINVAPQQFRQRTFVKNLEESLRECGMDPHCLQIELKESTVMENMQETTAALEQIHSLGIRIALDDFGVGYSSVGQLSRLPLDKLKIDRSFVSRISKDVKSQTVTDTILALGRSLNLKVVGEGIESAGTFNYLRGHGCDQAQGYYFSKPLSAPEFESWYKANEMQGHSIH